MTGARLSIRGIGWVVLAAAALSFAQSPGRVAADTKLDLTANPDGFLARSLHLWSSTAPMGQVQNQAYGYLFPHGAFFALGDLLALPAWVTQRLWWTALLAIGFIGIVRLAETLGIGSPGSRLVAATAFVISPRVLSTIGSISSETLPMMLAPWVLIPVIVALDPIAVNRAARDMSLRRLAFRSALAVAAMGAVNAVATAAACTLAIVWWLAHLPINGRPIRRWLTFSAWWAGAVGVACLWWIVPLLILSQVSPPFLDFIESSRVTTRWTSLTEVLRGTSSWTPFVSPDRVAGGLLVSQPVAVLATGAVAAAGLAGLAMRAMPTRGRLVTALGLGLLLMGLGYAGQLGSPVAEQVRVFLDGSGAPLRNVHKLDPLIRIPLALGIAHLLARAPLPGAVRWSTVGAALARPERSRLVPAALAVIVVIVGAGSLAWTGSLAPPGTYRSTPSYWQQTADWLREHAEPSGHPARALIVPGAPFAFSQWGLTRDEPIQPLMSTPWAVRDAIPLVPPGAIRAMDSVQRLIADGRGSSGLAPTLAQQGFGYVVLRADLAPAESDSARPILAQQALRSSPGLVQVARFGPLVGPRHVRNVVGDDGLIPPVPAITVYAVRPAALNGTGPTLVDLDTMPRVAGGPESLARLSEHAALQGRSPLGPVLLGADATRAGLPGAPVTVTDTPADRETNFGRVDDHSSAVRAAGDPRRTQNSVPDYPVPDTDRVQGQWLLNGQPGQVRVTASGSASDATQLGQSVPAASPVAAFDGNPNTAWVSRDLDRAVGQWLQVDFTAPRRDLSVSVTVGKGLGAQVTSLLVSTEAGTTVAQGVRAGDPVTIVAPAGRTRWLQVRAIGTENGGPGSQFAVDELSLTQGGTAAPLSITHATVLPKATGEVDAWDLGQELGGRGDCAVTDITRCSPALALAPEEPSRFQRTLSVPQAGAVTPYVWVRARAGSALTPLLADPTHPQATGAAATTDPRGSAAAAVDGDPGTTWVASDSSATPGAPPPTIDITLPTPRRVTGLTVAVPQGRYPAAPKRIAVDLGTGRQIRTVNAGGVIDLDPAVTDRIRVSVIEAAPLVNVNSLGFASPAPTGLAEVSVRVDGPALGVPDPDRVVRVGCDDGLSLSVGATRVGLSVTTTARQFLSGAPVSAVVCASGPLSLPAGSVSVAVDPGSALTVDSLRLERVGSAATGPSRVSVPQVTRWSNDHRRVVLAAADTARVLTVPESTNPGWRARAGATALTPIVINGWQQGWIVPAGVSGPVTIAMGADGGYRAALLIGLTALVVVVAGAVLPARARAAARLATMAAPPPLHAGWVSTTAIIAAAGLLCGVTGLVVSLGAVALVHRLRRDHPRVIPALAAGVFVVAAAGLSSGPWASGSPYVGFNWWVQLPALVAISVVFASAAWPDRRCERRDS
ncbi:alpha-(1-_3)-arabinofuranosyltransferase [Williamsia sp. CHRR-6]|uniref:alpha-(1->3)-arabinofuranosyltransferase n=1 Tax=Williamsia sp. CHRR-6 TaxID=2835871 RepID=UPI001BDB284F|nr:alpha-(1->3)-arabinofuranosyltransferase [Williamsia sp. CHRR-6]MBT0567472.1 DUF3367 domain-containing protein [Williamsia sp. CHRR-6]